MMPPTSIDGTDITGATIDGTDVTEITVDGDTVFSANAFDETIDDFEDNNLSEYTANHTYNLVASTLEGNFMIEAGSNGAISNQLSLVSFSGLPYYPKKGDVFSFIVRSGGLDEVGFGVPNNGTYTTVRTRIQYLSTDNFQFKEYDNGNSLQSEFSANFVSDTDPYLIEFEWHDGSGSEANNTIVRNVFFLDTSVDLSKNVGRGSFVRSDKLTGTTAPVSGGGIYMLSRAGGRFDRIIKTGTV